MFLHEKGGNLITLTENLSFASLNLDERFLEVVRRNPIGSEVVFKTKNITQDIQRVDTVYKLAEIRSECGPAEH